MDQQKKKALAMLILCNSIWGADFVNIEYLTSVFPPQFVNFGRTLFCAVFIWILAFTLRGGIHIEKKDWPMVLACGAFGTTIYGTMESFSIGMIGSAMASLILATVPIMGMVSDRIIYKKPITAAKVAAIGISIVGVYLLVFAGKLDLGSVNLLGIGLMFLTAAGWVCYILMIKPINEKYDMITALSGCYVGGLVTCIPVTLTGLPTLDMFRPMPIFILLFSSLFCIAMGNFMYVYAVKRLSVTTVSAFENVIPVITCIVAFIVFREMLTPIQMLGGVIIMGTVTWVSLMEGKGGAGEAGGTGNADPDGAAADESGAVPVSGDGDMN